MTVSSLSFSRQVGLGLGPLLFFITLTLPTLEPLRPEAQQVIAVVLWMLTWWISEAVELPVTALIPIVLFPVLGVLDVAETTASYANKIIFLFMGGFMIALALEKWNLHLRIALNIVRLTGTHANGIVLGFMLATAALSMWISNTATTVMMLPIATSVISLLSQKTAMNPAGLANFALTMMLGVAYAANVGGIATIIGTPPNTVMASVIFETYGYEISFARWLAVGLPFTLVMLLIIYWTLVKWVYPNRLGQITGSKQLIQAEIRKLGPMSRAEKIVLVLFITTALLWILRSYLNQLLPGLGLDDTVIAILATIALFIAPVHFSKGVFVLEWGDTRRLPWGILLLFGGGLSVANALNETGIIRLIGESVASNQALSIYLVAAVLTIIGLFMTEVMSNVALVAVITPVVAGIAVSLGQHPLWIAVPVTMASSCAFMLPMSTPPNAIVFASGHVKVAQMVKAGVILNVVSILLLILLTQTLLPYVFGMKLDTLPDWVK